MKHTRKNFFEKKPVYLVVLFMLFIALIFSLLLAVTIGSTSIPLADVYQVVFYKLFHVGDPSFGSGKIHDVVWFIRLPRLILAAAVGMSLSICGVVMQAVVKNPLAEPYVLGISSGASLGATLSIMLGIGTMFGPNYIGVMACLGAFLISIGVVALSNIGGRSTSVKLLLSGMALSSLCGAFSSFIVYFSNDQDGMKTVSYWMMGSLSGASWENNLIVVPLAIAGVIFFWTQYRTLNLMLLGDEAAVTLGTNLYPWRQTYLLVSSLMIGFVVYSSGVIGFVGLVIPHVVRMLFGTDHKKLIPLSALVGSIFLIWADVLCRVIIPGMELPIGVLTSMIGAPCFIYLMARKKYGFGGKE